MSTRTVELIDSWDTVPFSGGYGGLHDLADSEFSGAVVAGPTRLFMLNGNVVGILDGSIEDFEDASGTAREAPHPGLPLLAVMQERSDEVRAKYYTEDTPISEVDQTLSGGGFTGYVELSENVLSGDYYQIYHQGRSMSVAWVGNSDQLVTDDEAFEQANDEVGIYEVRPVDIEIVEVPEPEPTGAGAAATDDSTTDRDDGTAGGAALDDPEESGPQGEGRPRADETPTGSSGRTADTGSDPIAKTGTSPAAGRRNDDTGGRSEHQQDPEPSERTPDGTREQRAGETDSREETRASERGRGESPDRDERGSTERRDRAASTDQSEPREDGRRRSEPREEGRHESDRRESDRREADRRERTNEARTDAQPARTETSQPTETSDRTAAGRAEPEPNRQAQSGADGATASEVGPAPNDPSAGGASDLETRSIPSLDPSQSGTASAGATAAAERTKAESTNGGVQSDAPASPSEPGGSREQQRHPGAPDDDPADDPPATDHRDPTTSNGRERDERTPAETEPRGELSEPTRQSEPAADPERVSELERELSETEAERDQLQSELESLESERDELERELEEARSEIERLEERLEEMAAEDDDTPTAETRLSEREAIDQTNLFVRYNSKGDATLEAVHSGEADRSSVDDNLRLEYHTQFDAATAAVGDREFETFLTESIQFRFVDWLVRNLLFEIRDTGNPEAMAELYDALPKIDRAELNGQVTVQYTEDGEQHRAQEQFDVVVRDRMGNPLLVANINDSRDPATDDMMTDLITRAERVGSSSESLAGAFLVTESFFEPPALETAEEATSSGLLSRDKRKSFVNLSRKDGYHLCLVEARNQEFHLAVPEL
jgi:hypothetical protein